MLDTEQGLQYPIEQYADVFGFTLFNMGFGQYNKI